MFGHEYSDEELKALDNIREREMFGSISPAGIHGEDYNVTHYDSDEKDYKELYLKEVKKNRYLIKILTQIERKGLVRFVKKEHWLIRE